MTPQKIDFIDWLSVVDKCLRLMGYNHKALDENSWKILYDDSYSPFKAISESEFGGGLTFNQMRKLQNFKEI